MSNVERRLQKIEKMLNMDGSQRSERIIVLFDEDCPEQEALPKNIEDWVIYKEQDKNNTIGSSGPFLTLLMAADEVEARKRQKVT